MRVLINLATLKIGGGQNVALNLIHGLEKVTEKDMDFLFMAAEGTKVAAELKRRGCQTLIVSTDPKRRIIQERFLSNTLKELKIDIVYTMFGYASIGKRIPQVCGVADSNLFYPEIDFWHEYKGLKRTAKKIIDHYRLSGYKKADGLVFENRDMLKRYLDQYPQRNRAVFIKPSFVSNDGQAVGNPIHLTLRKDRSVGLFLCGWQLNKGIMKIPEIIQTARDQAFDLEIIVTAPNDDSDACKNFITECKRYNVLENVHLIGRVEKEQLKGLYGLVDYVFLLSRLESFSNCIIEAWNYERLLVISDLDWARSICGNGALYVNRDDINGIVQRVIGCKPGSPEYNGVVSNGRTELRSYPDIEERTRQELSFVREVYENHTQYSGRNL